MTMKSYLKIVVLAAMFASVCYWNSNKTAGRAASLVLQNIEALADNEFPSGNIGCFSSGSVDCPIGQYKVKYVIQGYSLK